MKMRNKMLALGSMLVLAGGLVVMQPQRTAAHGDTPQATSSSPTASTEQKPLTEEQKAQIKSRVEKYKAQAGVVNRAAEARLKLRCNVAQTVTKNVRVKALTLRDNRTKAYKNIADKLAHTVTKLKEKQIDTTKLEEQIATLNTKIAAFTTAAEAYKQAIDDMADMECTTDPGGFKAALDQARTAQRTMHTLATEIRTYVSNAIKPTLVQLRAELAKQSTTEGENNNASQ